MTILLSLTFALASSQEFVNGDLAGTITGSSSLPPNWLLVPYNDVNCLANSPFSATPDLTNYTQPDILNGIIGNPYSGNTFVSGLFSKVGPNMYQEGIMQTLSGFIPGNTYPINFHQAVVKQVNCLDSSGSWAVYVDTLLAGITIPTFCADTFNSTSFIWELRTITFVASSVTHTIKFLPIDDDTVLTYVTFSGIRMGIDCIYITNDCNSMTDQIKDYGFEIPFTIFPNPAFDNLNIEYYTNEPSEITLYDLSSRKLLQQAFTNTITINTEQLAKGIYLYTVRNRNGIIKNGKVIKQ